MCLVLSKKIKILLKSFGCALPLCQYGLELWTILTILTWKFLSESDFSFVLLQFVQHCVGRPHSRTMYLHAIVGRVLSMHYIVRPRILPVKVWTLYKYIALCITTIVFVRVVMKTNSIIFKYRIHNRSGYYLHKLF